MQSILATLHPNVSRKPARCRRDSVLGEVPLPLIDKRVS